MKPIAYYKTRPTISRFFLAMATIFLFCELLATGAPNLRTVEFFELPVSLASLGVTFVGVYYLLVRRTGVFIFDRQSKAQDDFSNFLSHFSQNGRAVAIVNHHDDLSRQALGWGMCCIGALWFFVPVVPLIPLFFSALFFAFLLVTLVIAYTRLFLFECQMK